MYLSIDLLVTWLFFILGGQYGCQAAVAFDRKDKDSSTGLQKAPISGTKATIGMSGPASVTASPPLLLPGLCWRFKRVQTGSQ
jgi:hypothetical protein